MNKIAIVYYSLSGNTDYVAKKINEVIESDLIRLNPIKEYPDKGFKKYYWCGKSAVMKDTPELEKYNFDANKYELIIFGSPVWASRFTPPIRTFINENKDKLVNKKLAAFVSYSGGGAEKALNGLKDYLNINNFVNTLILVDPKDKENKDNVKKINEFVKQIEAIINR